ncbi:hypothetical protein OG897_24080 [Streptomyces sp. NBC_00237]|uniref:hypothetical protein n=1 Tax=Streptomyces sp. NBC_00237 TaxID=2975687 RepID=UPI002259CA68|nr:hypothetical protein [Streptomyces sp. NBC_00237]MCX5204521.1 hypothetical protein [Streptomyces sp. NBC_00237]
MSQNLVLLSVAVAVLAVLGLHLLMARKGPAWLGAVVPCLWSVAVVVMAVQGRLDLRSSLVAVAAVVMLLWMWSSGRQARRKAEAGGEPVSTRRTS